MDNSGDILNIDYYGSSDIGLIRVENQDSYGKFPRDNFDLYSENGQLFIVADGMGGHTGGKEASSTAVDAIVTSFARSAGGSIAERVREAIQYANEQIYLKAQSSSENKKMGTTCVALALKDDKAVIAHVGDSRIYKIENNEIKQLTTDHTQVQEMLSRGILTRSEAEHYPSRSVLARALGVEKTVEIDVKEDLQLQHGQIFVLCTDGLAKAAPEEIKEIVTGYSPREACDRLIKIANDRGGKDNVTVQIIKINGKNQVPMQVKKRRIFPWFIFIAAVIIAAAYIFRDRISEMLKPSEQALITDSLKSAPVQETEIRNDKYSQLILQAEKFIRYGKYKRAEEMYKTILAEEPTHLGALKGLNNLAAIYLEKADALIEQNQYRDALAIYQDLNGLQPGNKKIVEMIIVCQNKIAEDTTSVNSIIKDTLNQ